MNTKQFFVCPKCKTLFYEEEKNCPNCGFSDKNILKSNEIAFYVSNGVLYRAFDEDDEVIYSLYETIEKIYIPSIVSRIGEGCFFYSNIKTAYLPEELKEIAHVAFSGCKKLSKIELPKNLTIIGAEAFRDSGVTTIHIPKEVKEIGHYAFYSCEDLTSVTFSCISAYISPYAFADCHALKNVNIKTGIFEIGSCSFKNCTALEQVIFPDDLSTIGIEAFMNCVSLKEITLPNSIKTIGTKAFYKCNSLTDIHDYNDPTLYGLIENEKELVQYFVRVSGAEIKEEAFAECHSLKFVELPESVFRIEDSAFQSCDSLENIELPPELDYIGNYAFCGCSSLKTISIPESVKEIRDYTFMNCESLLYIDISCLKIGKYAFKSCCSLHHITLSSLADIDKSAFEGCLIDIEKIAPFTDQLKKIDISSALGITPNVYSGYDIVYDIGVDNETKIPGLIEFIDTEKNDVLSFLNRIFNQEIDCLDGIKIVLSPRHETKTYGEPDQLIRDLVAKYSKYGVTAIPIDELNKAICSVPITDVLAGEYLEDIIYIYYREINAISTEEYLANIREVLAHELLHAIHHLNAGKPFNDDGVEAKRVKEALADFFGFMYCIEPKKSMCWNGAITNESIKLSEKKYQRWQFRWGTAWPYSYALCFFKDNEIAVNYQDFLRCYIPDQCLDKFRRVFKTSKVNMLAAYVQLNE